ncbi:hypothetical protein Syun_012218 [Stephania yunnanensis]|uniref:Uncharacterized protein n=1 Tax=Stephania yunnanensis TaxID=152371 RepID=A0AAP0K0F6_9MAGN
MDFLIKVEWLDLEFNVQKELVPLLDGLGDGKHLSTVSRGNLRRGQSFLVKNEMGSLS